jgi:hypothetical protein
MKFFKSVGLRAHAANLIKGFGSVRGQHFDFIVRQLQDQLKSDLIPSQLTPDCKADLALRGFQLWLYMAFSIMHPYVPDRDDSEFSSYVVTALSGEFKKEVEGYLIKFNEHRNNYPNLVCEVAFSLAMKIDSDIDPRGLAIIATLLPVLALNTQMVIADEFGDKTTGDILESQMKITREAMVNGKGLSLSGTDVFCFNCAFTNGHGARCCSLCGVPLIFVGPGCDPQFAQEGGPVQAQPEHGREETAPVSDPTQVETKSSEVPADMIEKGQYYRRYHFKGVSNWEERMYAEFGEAVVPLLKAIWNRAS